MIGVVVATHGKLAEELIRTAEAVVGKIEQISPMSIEASSPDMRGDLKAAIQQVDQGDGVLLLTDIYGGSPTNLCLSFLTERKVEVVTGVNLPMLLQLPSVRNAKGGIAAVAQKLVEAGQKSVTNASEALRRML
jgi:mannose PTS system EIIA component